MPWPSGKYEALPIGGHLNYFGEIFANKLHQLVCIHLSFPGMPRDSLFFADRSRRGIFIFPLKNSKGTSERVLALDVSGPVAVAVDSRREQLYWTDVNRKYIARASLDGTNQEIVVYDVHNSQGIAVDPVGKSLYWSSRDNGSIEVSSLDGSGRKKLLQTDSDIEPGGIALDYQRG